MALESTRREAVGHSYEVVFSRLFELGRPTGIMGNALPHKIKGSASRTLGIPDPVLPL